MTNSARNNPKVSLIMPNYNYGKYLDLSLKGALEQTYPHFELLFIDDASVDNSVEIAHLYAKEYPQLRVVQNKNNIGVYKTVEKGLSMALGEYVAFPGSDDYLFPKFLEKTVPLLDQNKDVGLCFSKFSTFSDNPNQFATLWSDNETSEMKLDQKALISKIKMKRFWIPGNTVLCRKELFSKEGAYDPKFKCFTDWYVFLKIAFRYGAYYLPETLSLLRVNGSSLSQGENLENKHASWSEMIRDLSKFCNRDLKMAFIRSHIFNTFDLPFFKYILNNPKYWWFFKQYTYKHFYKRLKMSSQTP